MEAAITKQYKPEDTKSKIKLNSPFYLPTFLSYSSNFSTEALINLFS